MTSMSPNSLASSSLEEMLESLRRQDGNEKQKDAPPELPTRPKPTSRARLPSAKRPLPGFEIEESNISMNLHVKKGDAIGFRGHTFGAKKVKEMEPEESPYVMVSSDEKELEVRLEERDDAKLAYSPRPSSLKSQELFSWQRERGHTTFFTSFVLGLLLISEINFSALRNFWINLVGSICNLVHC